MNHFIAKRNPTLTVKMEAHQMLLSILNSLTQVSDENGSFGTAVTLWRNWQSQLFQLQSQLSDGCVGVLGCKYPCVLTASCDFPIDAGHVKFPKSHMANSCLLWPFFFDCSCPVLPEVTFRVTISITLLLRGSGWEQNRDFCLDTLSPVQSQAVSLSLA